MFDSILKPTMGQDLYENGGRLNSITQNYFRNEKGRLLSDLLKFHAKVQVFWDLSYLNKYCVEGDEASLFFSCLSLDQCNPQLYFQPYDGVNLHFAYNLKCVYLQNQVTMQIKNEKISRIFVKMKRT